MGAKLAVIGGRPMFAMKVEEIGDLTVGRNETLALPRRFKAHHAPFSSSQRKVRILGAIV